MNYCPECGGDMEYVCSEGDVATDHHTYICRRCGQEWVVTRLKSGELLHISPVEESD